jgi:hypothetical protein
VPTSGEQVFLIEIEVVRNLKPDIHSLFSDPRVKEMFDPAVLIVGRNRDDMHCRIDLRMMKFECDESDMVSLYCERGNLAMVVAVQDRLDVINACSGRTPSRLHDYPDSKSAPIAVYVELYGTLEMYTMPDPRKDPGGWERWPAA